MRWMRLRHRSKPFKLPKLALEKATAELKKLRNMGPMSAEATVVRNYLDWIIVSAMEKKLTD